MRHSIARTSKSDRDAQEEGRQRKNYLFDHFIELTYYIEKIVYMTIVLNVYYICKEYGVSYSPFST